MAAERERRRRELEKGTAAAPQVDDRLTNIVEFDGVRMALELREIGRPQGAARAGRPDEEQARRPRGRRARRARAEGRASLLVAATPGAVERGVKAGDIVKVAAAVVGGGGGGRDTMAQAGGRDPEKLDEALADRARARSSGCSAPAECASSRSTTAAPAAARRSRTRPARSRPRSSRCCSPATRKGLRRVAALAEELGAERIVVGLPLSLSGGDSAQTAETRAFAERLQAVVRVPVELYDERFTTQLAGQTPGEAALDSRAAAILLDEWLTEIRTSADRGGNGLT